MSCILVSYDLGVAGQVEVDLEFEIISTSY